MLIIWHEQNQWIEWTLYFQSKITNQTQEYVDISLKTTQPIKITGAESVETATQKLIELTNNASHQNFVSSSSANEMSGIQSAEMVRLICVRKNLCMRSSGSKK